MNARTLTLVLTLVVAPLSASCRRAAPASPAPSPPESVIVGRVEDSFGRPIHEAVVSIRDSTFAAVTNEEGSFSLPFAPGSFHLTIEAPGCLPWSHDFQVTQAVRYPLGTKMLLRLPDGPPETVLVSGEHAFLPLPPVEFESRVAIFGPTFPNRCAEFFLRRPVPTLRGKVLSVVFPDRNFRLVRVENNHVTTDPFPYTIGVCPGGMQRVEVRGVDVPGRAFLLAEPPAPGTYCFIRSTRADPAQAESSRGYCFVWEVDPHKVYGPAMTPAPPAPPNPDDGVDYSDHGA